VYNLIQFRRKQNSDAFRIVESELLDRNNCVFTRMSDKPRLFSGLRTQMSASGDLVRGHVQFLAGERGAVAIAKDCSDLMDEERGTISRSNWLI